MQSISNSNVFPELHCMYEPHSMSISLPIHSFFVCVCVCCFVSSIKLMSPKHHCVDNHCLSTVTRSFVFYITSSVPVYHLYSGFRSVLLSAVPSCPQYLVHVCNSIASNKYAKRTPYKYRKIYSIGSRI